MLVLSRKRNEDIIVGEGDKKVIVRVLEIIGDRVRLGFVADQSVEILRAEVEPKNQEKTNGLERPAPGGPFYSFQ